MFLIGLSVNFFVSAVLALIVFVFSMNLTVFLCVFGVIFFVLFLWGVKKVPADPPNVAVVTVFGERTGGALSEGWRFFPFTGLWYGYILVEVTKFNVDLPEQRVRTPDLAELSVNVSVTIQPDRDNIIQFLNSGGRDGVTDIVTDIIRERLREWAIAAVEGPSGWQEALQAHDEATAVLVQEISGIEPLPTDASDEELAERRDLIQRARQGNGTQQISALGAVLNRLNVGEIKVLGDLADAADEQVKEEREREAEVVELQHIADQVQMLVATGISPERALELIQTERRGPEGPKVRKTIDEKKISLSGETVQAIAQLFPAVLNRGGTDDE